MMATSPKQQFLESYDREHATTMRVLHAFPKDKADAKLHPSIKTAKELAFVFVMECGLGMKVWHDELAKGIPAGSTPPKPPEKWDDLLAAVEKQSKDYRAVVSSTPDAKFSENVHFMVGPKKMGEISRLDWAYFLLHDQIHHRGQFSTYLRMAGGKVPSIYGPTADEPWI
jgi:uncharacterized damage-inducible protein DinB